MVESGYNPNLPIIEISQIYSYIPRSHSGSTSDDETREETEGRNQRTDIPPQAQRRCITNVVIGEKNWRSLVRMIALCADVKVAEHKDELPW